jgi:hypothetical protein
LSAELRESNGIAKHVLGLKIGCDLTDFREKVLIDTAAPDRVPTRPGADRQRRGDDECGDGKPDDR